jgi:hypothetical protein
VMSESLCTLIVAIWILVGLKMHRRLDAPASASAGRYVFLFGVVCAMAVLVRSELAVLSLVAVAILWRSAWRRRLSEKLRLTAILGVAALLVLAPWVVPNLFRFDRPVTLTTNDGTTLRGANCDRTYHGSEIGSWSVFCLTLDPTALQLETSQRSARWRSDGISYASDHAKRLPIVLAARAGRTLDLFGLDYQLDEDVRDGRPRLGSMLGIGTFWLLAPLALFGLCRRSRGTGGQRMVLWAPVIVVAISTLAFYGGHRIRAPMEPVVVLGSALSIVFLVDHRRSARHLLK